MKKLILITSLVTIFATSSASAKTEGHSASLDLLATKAHFRFKNNGADTFKDRAAGGLGIGYKYAFNFDGVFLRPGVFLEKNNLEYKSTFATVPSVNINNRYGAKVDVGYDIDKDLSVYVVGGVSFLNYDVTTASTKKSSSSKSDLFYGIGISHDYSEKVAFNLEYNTQSFNLKQSNGGTKIPVDLSVIKIGMNYKF